MPYLEWNQSYPTLKLQTKSPQASFRRQSSPCYLSWQNSTSAATNRRFNSEDLPPYFLPALPATTNMFRPCVHLREKARAKTSAINYGNFAALCRGVGLVAGGGATPRAWEIPRGMWGRRRKRGDIVAREGNMRHLNISGGTAAINGVCVGFVPVWLRVTAEERACELSAKKKKKTIPHVSAA